MSTEIWDVLGSANKNSITSFAVLLSRNLERPRDNCRLPRIQEFGIMKSEKVETLKVSIKAENEWWEEMCSIQCSKISTEIEWR